jgi:hypothetical protein
MFRFFLSLRLSLAAITCICTYKEESVTTCQVVAERRDKLTTPSGSRVFRIATFWAWGIPRVHSE